MIGLGPAGAVTAAAVDLVDWTAAACICGRSSLMHCALLILVEQTVSPRQLLSVWCADLAAVLIPGANVVLTTKGIDDMTLKYFVEAGVLAVRRVPKDDLK